MIRQDAHTNPEVLHLYPTRAQVAGLVCCEECGLSIASDVGRWTDNPDDYYSYTNHRNRCWQTPQMIPDFDWEVPEMRLELRDTVKLKPKQRRAV